MATKVRQLGLFVLAAFVACSTGCLHCFHPTPEPIREQIESTKQIPVPAKGCVYLFLLNGLDPLEIGNLNGVKEYVNCLGFGKVYYGQLYHNHWFLEEMQRIRNEVPESRFVVVGFEFGADSAKKLVNSANRLGIDVEELIYLEPKGLGTSSIESNTLCRKVLTIQSPRWLGHTSVPMGSDSIRLPRTNLYAVPTHPVVLAVLVEKLQEVAGTIPLVSTQQPEYSTLFGTGITPRPIETTQRGVDPEWDFLSLGSRQVIVSTSEKPRNSDSGKK